MKFRRIWASILILTSLTLLLSGCFERQDGGPAKQQRIKLVYYKMFDEEDVINPLIQQFKANNPSVDIVYRKFEDLEEYENLIINELAEGEGPDIFSVPNYWFLRHAKKISPASPNLIPPSVFADTFVSVATNDLVLRDPNDGIVKVFGIPLTVDTMALYYNKSTFEDKIPARGKPAATWEELKEDVFKITKTDKSFERFECFGRRRKCIDHF